MMDCDITLRELMEQFAAHRAEGWSAVSFQGRLKVGQFKMRRYMRQFPTFAKAYAEARESERVVSFYGNKVGPRGSYGSGK